MGTGGVAKGNKEVIKKLKAMNCQVSQNHNRWAKLGSMMMTPKAQLTPALPPMTKKRGKDQQTARIRPSMTRQKRVSIQGSKSRCAKLSVFRTLGSLKVTVEESLAHFDSHANQCAVVHSTSLIVHD
jgi:hypothetical protein